MAKLSRKNSSSSHIVLQGVSNYEKLKNLKKNDFNKYNPFLSQTFNEKSKQNHEAESLDLRYLDEDIYMQMLMTNGLTQNRRLGNRLTYYSMSKKNKRYQLQRMSIHDSVDDVLTKLCDEIVVSSKEKDPVKLKINKEALSNLKIKEEIIDEVSKYAQSEFKRIVKMYGFNQQGTETSLWNKVYLFLTEGTQAYEFVWDNIDNPKKIIGIHEIDALETEPFYSKGIKYWKHHKLLQRNEEYIIMYDTQILYIDWATASPNNRTSYLENLIKAFNDLRIIDESTITWTLTNSVYRMLIKVPSKGKSRIQSAQSLAQEKHRYNDDITYDSLTGEVSINGSSNLQMMKSYWMSSGDAGEPEIETLQNNGPDLTNMERNEYFLRKFYQAAKMPYSRFDTQGSATWNIDTRSQLREEINFGRFVSRIRSIIEMLYLKPLYLSIVARYPDLKDDVALDSFSISWNSYNVFEELMELDIINEKVEAISKMNESLTLALPDGGDMKVLALYFLLEKFLPEFSKEDFDKNDKLLQIQNTNLFKYQMQLARMQAKYDAEVNLDDATGIPDTEKVVAQVDKDINDFEYPEISMSDKESEDDKNADLNIDNVEDHLINAKDENSKEALKNSKEQKEEQKNKEADIANKVANKKSNKDEE